MFAQVFSSMADQSKTMFEPAFEFNRIALGQAQKVAEKQLALVNDYAKLGLSQLGQAAKISSVEDLKAVSEAQLKASQELSDKMVKDANDWAALGQSMTEEWKTFAESKFESAVKETTKAAKK
ncbi:phasin family protein [Pleionea litopenaei]|uniref:Phasin family protein n=1 Tax=Pleionea litopenaei TaxID=3070815 RepID=A0AA51RSA9_9GAMM|nr:phasin family protein [Pleionea sp. HL-JVS1]WMS86642.1 phasin family protein [Pleionea sp. HL-JVS1]